MRDNAGFWAIVAIVVALLAILSIYFGITLLIYWGGLLIKYLFKVSFEWTFVRAMAASLLVYIFYWIIRIFVIE